jgi:multicomponent Na+:H+ antiporter subunit F
MAIAFFRLYKGPTIPDRIVALDLVASISVGIIITLSFYRDETLYLDIAVFVALIVFIGTVAVSKYLKGRLYD